MFRKTIILTMVVLVMILAACSVEGNTINVISRESGSGTRGAFIELFGIEQKKDDGGKVDRTTLEAIQLNGTQQVMSTVAGDRNAIGYISMGSLNSSVKALKIDGSEPTIENIKDGTYKIARPFNIATKDDISDIAQDFISFILSSEGQKVVEDNGYINNENSGEFASSKAAGKIVVSGSSSVTPVMEKLREAYIKINSNADIEIQMTDSTSGMQNAINGICDIGMASRELKDSEKAELNSTVIALDGIAVIVNKDNEVNELTSEQVRSIYIGEITSWDDVK